MSVWAERGHPLTPLEGDARLLLETSIPRDEWFPAGWPGVWRVVRPAAGFELSWGSAAPPELAMGGRPLEWVDPSDADPNARPDIDTGSFTVVGGMVVAKLELDERPLEAVLGVPLDRGAEHDGRWRLSLDRIGGDGFPLWTGERVDVQLASAGASRLTFGVAARAATMPAPGDEVTLRVSVDGEVVLEDAFPPSLRPEPRRRAVDLPALPRGGTLTFELDGALALGGVFAPVVGPRELGTPRERPWRDERPDVVLFVADTLRADQLGTFGGTLDLTPRLDAFAEGCVAFTDTRAPATWTLPSHASMFTGLWPHQHGATGEYTALSADATTLAEHLGGLGYRTVAVTDQGFVSRHFGVDQGFEWFDEQTRTLPETLAATREALDADDGRPLFLFVQTYRVHEPYTATERTREALADRVRIEGEWLPVERHMASNPWGWQRGEPIPAEMRELLEQLRGLYLGGVRDLDDELGAFLAELEAEGLFERAWFVFTSDHGEGFGEHEEKGHGTGVWDEQARVPLLVRGPGLAPGPEAWGGASLLSLETERPLFSFQCSIHPGPDRSALVTSGSKVLFPVAGEELAGRGLVRYDLELDPDEATPLEGAEAAALLEEHRAALEEALTPRLESTDAYLGPGERAALAELGYAGD
jgi:hypothetical protein